MLFANRINSVLSQRKMKPLDAIDLIREVDDLTHVDLNYPEHFSSHSVEEYKDYFEKNNIKLNGLAMRFRDDFKNGELGNSKQSLADQALSLCKEGADVCRELGGEFLTIWLGYDGFDYPFQLDYQKTWEQVVAALKVIADYADPIKISIEYKPYEERAFALIDSVGSTLHLLDEVGADNIGVTLDYCHMRMKGENPAFSLALAARKNKLFGVHLNDGYGLFDDGLMVGSASLNQTLEFIYYLKKYEYSGVIYFDTFPERELALDECRRNAQMTSKLFDLVDRVGMDVIDDTIRQNSGIAAQDLLFKFLR